jgi:dipeptidyl aminopeptidase/acylaminoacyl peptidase
LQTLHKPVNTGQSIPEFMTDRSVLRSLILPVVFVLLIGTALLARTMWGHYRAVLHDFEPAPASAILAHPDQTGIHGLSAIAFESRSGDRIAGWYAPSRNRAAVIVTHGTNTDRSSMLDEIRILSRSGFGVLAFDWPGDGESEGEVRWGSGERNALSAAIDWLERQPDIDRDRLGAFGFSMGGYFTIQVAAADPRLRAVVIAAAPTSFLAYTRASHQQHGWLSRFPAELAIRRVGMANEVQSPIDRIDAIAPRPILLLGGSEDRSIPPTMMRQLFDRAGEPKELWIVDGARHGHYFRVAPTEYSSRVSDFYAKHLLDAAASRTKEGKLHTDVNQVVATNLSPRALGSQGRSGLQYL